MIEIERAGINGSLKVSGGAYESHYKANGWVPVRHIYERRVNGASVAKGALEEDRIEALLSAPLSNWSQQDVKYFAEHQGISLNGTKSLQDAKERVKSAIDEMLKK